MTVVQDDGDFPIAHWSRRVSSSRPHRLRRFIRWVLLLAGALSLVFKESTGGPFPFGLDEAPGNSILEAFLSAKEPGRVQFSLRDLGLVIKQEKPIVPTAHARNGSVDPQSGHAGEQIIDGAFVRP